MMFSGLCLIRVIKRDLHHAMIQCFSAAINYTDPWTDSKSGSFRVAGILGNFVHFVCEVSKKSNMSQNDLAEKSLISDLK